MQVKNFSFDEAFRIGWGKFKEHWVFLVGSALLVFFASGLFSYLSDEVYKDIQPTSGLLGLIGLLLRIWLNFNLLAITIRIIDGEKPEWADLFVWRPETLSYAGASILYGLIVVLGLLFFVIPGLYLAIKYQFYSYLVADKRLGAFEALRASGELTDGVKWPLIGFGVVTLGVAFLGLLAFGIGLLVALPVISFAYIVVYRALYQMTFAVAGPLSAGTAAPPATPPVGVSQTVETVSGNSRDEREAPVSESLKGKDGK
jgi:uncharacterized membrane protein